MVKCTKHRNVHVIPYAVKNYTPQQQVRSTF
jgi:hypothetical protein